MWCSSAATFRPVQPAITSDLIARTSLSRSFGTLVPLHRLAAEAIALGSAGVKGALAEKEHPTERSRRDPRLKRCASGHGLGALDKNRYGVRPGTSLL